MTPAFSLPGCEIDRVTRGSDRLVIHAHARRDHGRCPSCGTPSSAVHSRYDRHPADLPCIGRAVDLCLQVRRFYYHRVECRRRTFVEPLPKLLPQRARRTRRLAQAQARIGLALGGEAGARLLPHLAMSASPDTVLRLVRGLPLPAIGTPRVIGIDDWAEWTRAHFERSSMGWDTEGFRKGRTYGTLLVDLERRRPLDILPDRSGATVAAWLRRRPQIAVIARDRSTEYARAATRGAPTAVQVADRWHLLLNMRQALERWLSRTHARLRRLPTLAAGDGRQPGQCLRAYPRSDAEVAASADSRARWLAAYEEVRRRHLAGESALAIGRATGLARGTVRRYAHADSFPERAVRRPNASRLDPYLAHIEKNMAEGCENAMTLWREVRAQGFAGSHRQVHRFVAERRTATAPRTARKWLGRETACHPGPSAPSPLPSPKQLAWILVQPVAALSPHAAAAAMRVEQDREAARVAGLAQRFTALVRRCGVACDEPPPAPCCELDAWLAEASTCGVRAIETFAAGLNQDGATVRAAITTPWSNGQAEGQITRVKLIKRTMYGRASFDLLRRRVLVA